MKRIRQYKNKKKIALSTTSRSLLLLVLLGLLPSCIKDKLLDYLDLFPMTLYASADYNHRGTIRQRRHNTVHIHNAKRVQHLRLANGYFRPDRNHDQTWHASAVRLQCSRFCIHECKPNGSLGATCIGRYHPTHS